MEQNNTQHSAAVNMREIYVMSEMDVYAYTPDSLKPLYESICQDGIVTPVRLANRKEGGYYLIDGKRRCLAAAMAGIKSVPAIVQELPHMEVGMETVAANLTNVHLPDSKSSHMLELAMNKKQRSILFYAEKMIQKWKRIFQKRKPPRSPER